MRQNSRSSNEGIVDYIYYILLENRKFYVASYKTKLRTIDDIKATSSLSGPDWLLINRPLGIIKIIESKDYRKNIYNLLNYIPEGILILDKSKKIIYTNNSASEWFQTKIGENISAFLRNPDLLSSIDKAFDGNNLTDLEIEIRSQSTYRLNITIYLDKNNLFFDETSCFLFIRDLTEFHKFQQLKSDFVANV